MFSLQTILGRKDQIHELLQASSGAALDAARAADRLTHDSDSALSVATFTAARRREKELAMQISEALINTFVTSLDREDVEAINSALYRIPKILERFADRYVLVHEELVGIDFTQRTAILVSSTDTVVKMIAELQNGLNIKAIRKWQERLQALEAEADKLLLEPYRDLYINADNLMRAVLAKDVFETLERAIDACRDVCNVVYAIVLKNA